MDLYIVKEITNGICVARKRKKIIDLHQMKKNLTRMSCILLLPFPRCALISKNIYNAIYILLQVCGFDATDLKIKNETIVKSNCIQLLSISISNFVAKILNNLLFDHKSHKFVEANYLKMNDTKNGYFML